jgi:hypothetical protein
MDQFHRCSFSILDLARFRVKDSARDEMYSYRVRTALLTRFNQCRLTGGRVDTNSAVCSAYNVPDNAPAIENKSDFAVPLSKSPPEIDSDRSFGTR